MTDEKNAVIAADVWTSLLRNGKSKFVEVKNPVFEKGQLISIEDLRPFNKKDADGKETVEPTLSDAQMLKRTLYTEFFKKPFKNLLILSGAGSSMDVGGLSMKELWSKVHDQYKTDKEDGFALIRAAVKYTSPREDLEALLSQLDGYCKFAGDITVTLDNKSVNLSAIKATIFGIIKEKCSIPKPTTPYPHKVFLGKLLQRKQTNPRVKVFTLNYDLLFEHAATDVNAIVIDGFSFTFPRTFSGRYFDYDIVQREGSKLQEEDNFIQRVFHLHKLHGSLNWEIRKSDLKIIVKEDSENPLMVYPREAKYEDSYEQPFFEMMARFQRSLRINNDTLLVCLGYSFNDKHINAAIEEALNQNPSFRIAVLDPYFDSQNVSESLKTVKAEALESERVLMISETFTDFARHFPEIQTYDNEVYSTVQLKNAQS